MTAKKPILKQQLGQYFTTNSKYIVGDLLDDLLLNHYKGEKFIDPFAGNLDLLNLLTIDYEAYDLNPIHSNIIQQNTLITPPDYKDKWVLTNPPWLAQNRNPDPNSKSIYQQYGVNDLYKAFLKSFDGLGGIIICPVNLWCEEKKEMVEFLLDRYWIKKVKVFEEQIFLDTTYSGCAFLMVKKEEIGDEDQEIEFEFYRGSKFSMSKFISSNQEPLVIKFKVSKQDHYHLSPEFIKFVEKYKQIKGLKIGRLVGSDRSKNSLVLMPHDQGDLKRKIRLVRRSSAHIDRTKDGTERSIAGIKIVYNGVELILSVEQQDQVCRLFNEKLEQFRIKTNSMCLTNYRDASIVLAKKRLAFGSAYAMIGWSLLEAGIIDDQVSDL